MWRIRTQRKRDAHKAGFSLLEVLVAFTILAVSLGAIYQAFGVGARNAHASESYTAAVLLANSRLAGAGIEIPLVSGTTEGTFGRYTWRQTVTPASGQMEQSSAGASKVAQLYEVTVTVSWGDTIGTGPRNVTLRTLRLGEPES